SQAADLAGKRLELLREVVPGLRHLAIMSNAGYPAAVLEMGEAESAARTLGLDVVRLEIRRAQDIAPAFEALKGRAEALYVTTDPILNSNHVRIPTLANLARLPMIATQREYVDVGSLMSAAEQVRSRPQSDRRQGARPDDPRIIPAARRRGDRVKRRDFM